MNEEQLKVVEPVLDTFENNDIKDFAIALLNDMPEYIWIAPASSSGRFHPDYSQGDGGLMRHQVAVVRFINFFFELEQYQEEFNSRERDLVRLSGLVHDGRKSGNEIAEGKKGTTCFEHPILQAKAVMKFKGQFLNEEELKIIAGAVGKHMGQWNTSKKTEMSLPKPNDKFSKIVHLADYLSSRKSLEMSFENYEKPKLPDLETFIVPMGKYKGALLIDVAKEDPNYITWMKENIGTEPTKSLLKNFN